MKIVYSYKATELANLDGVTRQTVMKSKKYIKVAFKTWRSKNAKKEYSYRYIRKKDID